MKRGFRVTALVLAVMSTVAVARPSERRIERRVRISTDILADRMASRHAIPQSILQGAQCVASVRIVKAGFIWGGEGSTGLVSCKTREGEWSAPSFLNVGGASFGLQIGLQFVDSVWVFMTQEGRRLLNGPSFKLGADLSFAAGPVGQGTGVGVTPRAHVLTYADSVGLFAGIAINGLVVGHGPQRNQEVYGHRARPSDILLMPGSHAPEIVQPYVRELSRFAPGF